MAVAASEVNGALRDYRAGEKDIELIGNRLVFRLEAVYSFGLKPPLASGRELPFDGASLRIQRIKFAVVTTGVDNPIRNCRRRRNRSACLAFPNLPPGFSLDGVDVSVVPAEVERLVVEDRRRDHAIARREFPFYAMKLTRCLAGIGPGMRRIAPEHCLRLRELLAKQRHSPDGESKKAHGVRRITKGTSKGPCVNVPFISRDSLRNRPS